MLPNFSRSKGNQKIKFGQLIEYNMRNIFVKNNTQNTAENLFQDSFLKNLIWVYLCINSLKTLYSFLLLYPNLRIIEI